MKYLFILTLSILFLSFNNIEKIKSNAKSNNLQTDTIINGKKFERKISYNNKDTLDGYWSTVNDTIFFIPQYVINMKCENIQAIPMFSLKQTENNIETSMTFLCNGNLSVYLHCELLRKYTDYFDTIFVFRHYCDAPKWYYYMMHDAELELVYDENTKDSIYLPKDKEIRKILKEIPNGLRDNRILIYSLNNGIIGYTRSSLEAHEHCLY